MATNIVKNIVIVFFSSMVGTIRVSQNKSFGKQIRNLASPKLIRGRTESNSCPLPTTSHLDIESIDYVTSEEPQTVRRNSTSCFRRVTPAERSKYQYKLLEEIFPNFPPAMMKMMFIREQGNSFQIYNFLHKMGWCTTKEDKTLIRVLDSTPNVHLSTHYFWGEWKDSYLQITCQPGSYFTTAEEFENSVKYYLLYTDSNGKMNKEEIFGPTIPPFRAKSKAPLVTPFPRPKSLPKKSLVWFL